ncbi:MAG TPA: DUF4878 domain-containing protein [Pyrinomonadaceae bacterium]|jgi:hypothetical protein
MLKRISHFAVLSLLITFVAIDSSVGTVKSQTPQLSPTETVRQFYKALREKKFREAFNMSIYRPAIEGLTSQEFDDFRTDFENLSAAVSEKIPEKVEITGEQISGDTASVFLKVLDADGKEKIEPAMLIKMNDAWLVGDRESFELVKKAGKQFFFEARINTHHSVVQDMLTRISVAQVVYSQQHEGKFASLAELIAAALVPKDIETPESTGYRFQVNRSADGKSWYATAEPAQYGRSGRFSFYLDATGVRSGDNGGKPISPK